MTREDYDRIDQALQEAEKDDTPFLVAKDDELIVVGDANKTELNIHDFEITFRLPPKDGDQYQFYTKKFKNVYVTPRQETRVLKCLTALMPFYNKIDANGGLEKLSKEEVGSLLMESDEEMFDIMYELVSVVLGIDRQLQEYMLPASVLTATDLIIQMFPEAVNEANVFFAKSFAKR